MNGTGLIEVFQVGKRYGDKQVLDSISFGVRTGEMLGIIGPNGSGKSTLLRILTGVEPADTGKVLVRGRDVRSYSRKKLARIMAVLEQDALPPVGFGVRDIVEMGRYPHQNWLGMESGDPGDLLNRIMERLDLVRLADRRADELSGGERQRVALGKAMAQQPQVLLLDEPTTFLDIGYQLQMLDFIRAWQRESGLTVIAVLHDLNLAALYCERLLVLKDGRLVEEGGPWDIMREDLIEQVYGTRPLVVRHPQTGLPQLLLHPQEQPTMHGVLERPVGPEAIGARELPKLHEIRK